MTFAADEISRPSLGVAIAEFETLVFGCLMVTLRIMLWPVGEGVAWIWRDFRYRDEWRIEWVLFALTPLFWIAGVLSTAVALYGHASLLRGFIALWFLGGIVGLVVTFFLSIFERILNER